MLHPQQKFQDILKYQVGVQVMCEFHLAVGFHSSAVCIAVKPHCTSTERGSESGNMCY